MGTPILVRACISRAVVIGILRDGEVRGFSGGCSGDVVVTWKGEVEAGVGQGSLGFDLDVYY